MEKPEKLRKEKAKEDRAFDDILTFDYYNYRLEALVKKIKSKKYKNAYIKA